MARLACRALGWTLGALLLALAVMQLWFLGHLLWWNMNDPRETAFMARRLEALREHDPQARLRQQWLSYERISVHLKRAVIAAEDANFMTHDGFDWEAIQRALERNRRQGRIVAGASTVSQQLARNLFLSGERSWARKAQEAAITWMMETVMPKRRILEIYLNVAEWGVGVFGAEAAARHYFGIGASALSPAQAAWLAAILPAPQRHDRNRQSALLARKVQVLLARMPAAGIP